MIYHPSQEELEFLKHLAEFAIATPAVLKGVHEAIKIIRDAIEAFKNYQLQSNPLPVSIDAETLKLFSSVFLGTKEKITLLPAQHKHKPNFLPKEYVERQTYIADIFTAPSLKTANAFIRMFEAYEGRIKSVDQLQAAKGDGNIVVMGSPTSNFISRIALGYKENKNSNTGAGVKGAKYIHKDAFELKIRYALDEAEILGVQDSPHHYVYRNEDGEIAEVLNWGIRKSNGEICLPETQNKVLMQDYLLISCLPNTFNKHSYDAGHRLINIGGAHREGTLAAEKLFSDKAMLTELSEHLQVEKGKKDDTRFWQALVLVDSNPTTGNISLNHVMEYCPIDIHERAIEAVVQANHEALMSFGAQS
jgi:hypothetical protein